MNRTTFKVNNDPSGWSVINAIRVESKAYNLREKANALLDPNYQAVYKSIVLFGRLGKNNPNRSKYSRVGHTRWSNPSQRILLKDAAQIAVYINPMLKHPGTAAWPCTSYNLTNLPFNIHK